MRSFRSDPLLGIARGVLIFVMAVMIVAAAGLAIGLAAIVVMYPTVLAKLAEHGVAPVAGWWSAFGVILLGAAMVAIVFRFTQLLKHIVDTVGEGDPFIPDNAVRLNHMAWLTIAMQAVGLAIASLAYWLAQAIHEADADIDVNVDINALMLALVLFILARVFRRGAEMREELEGTV